MPIKTYPIFLASSYELQPEREKFEIFIGRQNKRLQKRNVQLRLEIWEDMGAELNDGRKQDDYNKILKDAEIVVVLFWTKMGKYTREEFDQAFQNFKNKGKPIIYVYEKTIAPAKIPQDRERESKADFINQLLTPGMEQFHSSFEHYAEFLFHFQQYLFDLFDQKRLLVGKPPQQHSLKAPHSPSFVIGREKEMEKISKKLSNKGIIVLVSGEGGIGKTTLAANYWHENKYTYGNFVYLFCEGGIINAMLDDGLGLELHGLPEEEKILQIRRKLNEFGDDVLLLLDNANEDGDITKFLKLFSGFNGNVLITSRCREVLPNPKNEILLKHLNHSDSKTLFLKYYKEEHFEFDELLNKLLIAIDYHTLLIEVFSKNLRKASARGRDLKSFLQSFEDKGIFLERKVNTRVETDYAFYINKGVASPNDILEVLYDFSNLGMFERFYLINLAFLPIGTYNQQFLVKIFKPRNLVEFHESLDSLYQKGWIGGEYDSLRLGPVIQKLVLHKNREALLETSRDYLGNLIVLLSLEKDQDSVHRNFEWIPFGRQITKIFKKIPDRNFALFFKTFAILLNRKGGKENLLEAKSYLEMALDFNISNFGEKSSYVVSNRSNLALVLRDLGGERNLIEAKSLLEQALDWAISKNGVNSLATAEKRSNLAYVLQALGGKKHLLEAKLQLEKALASAILNSGEDADLIAKLRSNLASILKDLGGRKNLLVAKTHLEKALTLKIFRVGENAPSIAIMRCSLAHILHDLSGKKNLLKAKYLLEKALSSDISNFGEDSHAAAKRLTSLGMVLRGFGEVSYLLEARPHLEKALELAICNFGDIAPITAIRRNDLGLLLKDLGGKKNLLEAKNHLQKALASDISNFGETAPVTAISQSNLALVLGDLGGKKNLLEAKNHLQKALASDVSNFGETAPSTATKRSNLALMLGDLGGERNLEEATFHLKKALASDVLNFGELHPTTIIRQYNLGSILVDRKGVDNLVQGLSLFEKALAGCRRIFSEDYYLIPKILNWIEYAKEMLRKNHG
ncbi:tetratricopeptide repeat protein [Cyclobacterium salsum]|uniref:tetratricopeptide repeat protein n=1 Tax=Cyclobacterium salsum TaxID=2666329 RepID=UPI001391D689|nr:tetratricopeptide repeat protein [Cyclobacterium salsum]